METSEYLTIVAIAVSMVLSALGLFFGIMLRAKGPYRTGWTDVPIEQQLQDGEFRCRKVYGSWASSQTAGAGCS